MCAALKQIPLFWYEAKYPVGKKAAPEMGFKSLPARNFVLFLAVTKGDVASM